MILYQTQVTIKKGIPHGNALLKRILLINDLRVRLHHEHDHVQVLHQWQHEQK